jgi:hypothetical protein
VAEALPSSYRMKCPQRNTSGSEEDVRQVRRWCNNLREDCLRQLDQAATLVENALAIDRCIYSVKYQYERDELKRKHDEDCHHQFGN